jgi:hypothetical protein
MSWYKLTYSRGSSAKDPILEVNASSYNLYGGDNTISIPLTYNGDGAITVSSSDTSIATVSYNNGNIIVTYVASGSVTVTVQASKTSKFKEKQITFGVECIKSTANITLSTSTLSIAGATGSGTFTFSYTGDGAISVTSSATGVATVSRSGTTVTVTYVNAGSSTITVSLGNGTKYAAISKTCAVTCSRSNRTVTLSKTSASLTGVSPSTTLTITFTGDGNLDYASTNTGVANVSVNKRTTGATATITRAGNGSCTVNFSLPQTNKWNASGNKGVSVSCSSGSITFTIQNRRYDSSANNWFYATFSVTYGTSFKNTGQINASSWQGYGSYSTYPISSVWFVPNTTNATYNLSGYGTYTYAGRLYATNTVQGTTYTFFSYVIFTSSGGVVNPDTVITNGVRYTGHSG